MEIYYTYFKRIFSLCLVLQGLFSMSFAILHLPAVLEVGLNLDLKNLFIILALRVLEWFNILTIIPFLISVLIILNEDFKLGNCLVLFIQIRKTSLDILKILIANSLFCGSLLIICDIFLVPYTNVYLKNKMVEMYKTNFLYSIQPSHIIKTDIEDIQISIIEREKNQLYGCLLHHDNYNATLLIDKIIFFNNEFLDFELYKGKSKFIINCEEFFINFEAGTVIIEADSFLKQNKKLTILEINTLYHIFAKIKLLIFSIICAFFIFLLMFSLNQWFKYLASVLFLWIFLDVMEIIHLSNLIFLLLICIFVYCFWEGFKCLNF